MFPNINSPSSQEVDESCFSSAESRLTQCVTEVFWCVCVHKKGHSFPLLPGPRPCCRLKVTAEAGSPSLTLQHHSVTELLQHQSWELLKLLSTPKIISFITGNFKLISSSLDSLALENNFESAASVRKLCDDASCLGAGSWRLQLSNRSRGKTGRAGLNCLSFWSLKGWIISEAVVMMKHRKSIGE